ncbi:pyridoxal phosphate-dependent decarboxylase family protein [Asanoa siamensis]|uniref:Uncharacterized protein n=1 Tax=Asanoa siamensis TaxID=926357 RepID=A0ABQ4CKR2_9ACTN|nr:pyridoxal-dependent decarboxylase [Asanoa siamensis]GIF71884.1 hypothetical protein Asi02nite_14020 [Asanoa siamensis]
MSSSQTWDVGEFAKAAAVTVDALSAYVDESQRGQVPVVRRTAPPDVPSALGDLVHGVTNNVMSVYEMGAAAATVEFEVLRWMLDKALVANACATATGLYDDLRGVGEFCREHGIWLHVDGAHGASALLSPRHRHLLDGIDLADSVVWDAHKMLRTSGVAAAVLTRDEAALDAAFHQEASYLFYGEQRFDQVRRTVEGTKAALGLKIFLNVAWRGEDGLGDYVARQYETAHRFWELAREYPGVHCPYEPDSNIVCFRVGDGDQRVLRDRLIDEGSFHLSSVEIGGVRHLRLTAMSPATDEETLRALLRRVTRLATEP